MSGTGTGLNGALAVNDLQGGFFFLFGGGRDPGDGPMAREFSVGRHGGPEVTGMAAESLRAIR
jgi:hypothetical protein